MNCFAFGDPTPASRKAIYLQKCYRPIVICAKGAVTISETKVSEAIGKHIMRKTIFRPVIGGSLALSLMAGGVALAQTSQSADQIINALQPTGSLSETTRGIKPLSPDSQAAAPSSMMTPASMSAAPAMRAPAMAPSGAPSAHLVIAFASGSADLTPRATAQLDQLGKALTSAQLAAFNFKIVGHTDTVGDAASNQTLSEQRAQAVKSYLEAKFNVADARLQAKGVGEDDLMVQTPPQTPNSSNREVQIINLGQ